MPSSLTNILSAVFSVALISAVASSPLPHHYPEHQQPVHTHHGHGTAGCGKWHHGVDQLKTFTIPSNGGEREFALYLPANYEKHRPTSMLLSFHGSDTNPAEHAASSHFNHSKVNPDMIVVFPQAVDCLWQGTPHARKNISDKQFTSGIINYMRDNFCIDNRRIYASGYGIGGGFVDTLACSPHHGEDFAAFAMVAPALFTEADGSWCKPERPLPILESKLPSIRLQKHVANLVTVHGADDDVNCYNDSKTEGVPYLSIPDFLKRWAKRDSCNKIPDSCTKHDGLVHTTSYTCQGMENFIEGVHLVGQKHGWPSTQTNMHNNGVKAPIDASKTIIEFFKKHYNRHA